MDYFSLHNHTEISNFRFKDSTIRIESLVDRAIELGYKGVAITDHEALSGHVRMISHLEDLRYQMKHPEDFPKAIQVPEDFKIALGNEIYLIDSLEDVRDNYESGVTKYWHFILCAKDREGYDQLKEISSCSAWKNYFRQAKQERVPTVKSELEAIIGENKGHLIASAACMGSELDALCTEYFLTHDKAIKAKIHNFIRWCVNVFGKENFFIELQPSAGTDSSQSKGQAFANQCLLKVAKAYGLKWIVTTDSHYLKKEHRQVHEAYLKSDDTNGGSRETGDFYETTYMCDVGELKGMLTNHISEEDAQAALDNTLLIYDAVTDYTIFHDVIVPTDPHTPQFKLQHLFKDWYDKYEYIKLFAYSDNLQERYFLALCEEGFLKYNQEFNDTTIGRINTEFKEMWLISEKLGNRIASYYTLVRAIIHEVMWKVSYVGVARGSVTGYYTAYLSGITQISPLPYNLPHWRHLTAERPSGKEGLLTVMLKTNFVNCLVSRCTISFAGVK